MRLENELLRQRLADSEQNLSLSRGETEKFKINLQEFKRKFESAQKELETEKSQQEEQISALKSTSFKS